MSLPLQDLLRDASQALACLDSDRLEALAVSCRALNPFDSSDAVDRARLTGQAQSVQQDLAVFARVLAATRANIEVMRRLEGLREGKIEYGARWGGAWAPRENRHGND
ncbi:MAG: hypothetical protein WCC26_19005 [Terracidiphilus sp.]